MAAFTLIASRDPTDSDPFVHDLACALAGRGEDVAVFLVENGTVAARAGVPGNLLARLTGAGVRVFADQLSLEERGIVGDKLASEVEATGLETLADHLAFGRKCAWF